MKKKIELGMAIILVLSAAILSQSWGINKHQQETIATKSSNVKSINQKCIVIDAGHGGDDPGKIGINGALEKDINLNIAHKLKALLESQDYKVVMTRTTGDGLYKQGTQNMKVEDMHNRCDIITENMPVFTISIHQNSYSEEYVKGAQVFYYGQSKDGEELAKKIQASMIERLDPENHRIEKANESYYLLKKTPTPTVIVECGFLSNSQEAELLTTDNYQNQVAWAVMMGVLQYLSEE